MCSTRDDAALPAPGCPIRESAGQRPFSASPRLIAAVHALLRLLMPRHPPCALLILTVIKAGPEAPAAAGLSKLDSMRRIANGPAPLSGRRSRRRRDWRAPTASKDAP